MPCMGPKEPRDEVVKNATENVLESLGVFRQDINTLVTPLREERLKTIKQLEDAIREVIFQEYCEEF